MQIISASKDSSVGKSLGWTNRGSMNTEMWHIGHELAPNRPLCDANLSGQFRRTKGRPNCALCINCYSLNSISSLAAQTVLLALADGLPMPEPRYKGDDHYELFRSDLIAETKNGPTLTSRGKFAVQDLRSPAGFFDYGKGILHGRRGLMAYTNCGRTCIQDEDYLEAIQRLHAQAHKQRDNTVTCLRCAVAQVSEG